MINCVACHAPDGGGAVGPNFCDDYWIHGGKKEDLVRIINEGVLAKGMISWKTILNKEQIDDVADFILSLQGTTPANPKEPQGSKVDKS
jgi:cytochrome c oxidase cbb3-type subunit 3